MSSDRIALIGLSETHCEELTSLLTRHNYVVAADATVDDALDVAETAPPSLVMIDTAVAGDNMGVVVQRFRGQTGIDDLPVLALVADVDEAAALRSAQPSLSEVLLPQVSPEEMIAVVRVHLEVTRLRREVEEQQQELTAANLSLGTLLEMKNRFVRLTTHDLKTPVTTLKLIGDVLEKQLMDGAPPGIKRLLDTSARNLAKMEAKLDELALIARMDLGEEQAAEDIVDCNVIVQQAISLFVPNAISRGIDLDALFGEVPMLTGDALRLRQMVTDLISMSLERVDIDMRVLVETSAADGMVTISVSDNAVPIPDDQIETLLAGLDDKLPAQQTRVSLYSANRIARQHGGRLEIVSGNGGETSFSVSMKANEGM